MTWYANEFLDALGTSIREREPGAPTTLVAIDGPRQQRAHLVGFAIAQRTSSSEGTFFCDVEPVDDLINQFTVSSDVILDPHRLALHPQLLQHAV
jgi:hypothetical protein